MDAGKFQNVGGIGPHAFRADKPALPKAEGQEAHAEQTDFVTIGQAPARETAPDTTVVSEAQVDASKDVAAHVSSVAVGAPMILTDVGPMFGVGNVSETTPTDLGRMGDVNRVGDLTWYSVDSKVMTTLDPLVQARQAAEVEQRMNAVGVAYGPMEGLFGPNNMEEGFLRFW